MIEFSTLNMIRLAKYLSDKQIVIQLNIAQFFKLLTRACVSIVFMQLSTNDYGKRVAHCDSRYRFYTFGVHFRLLRIDGASLVSQEVFVSFAF